jgi:hypothetical protein
MWMLDEAMGGMVQRYFEFLSWIEAHPGTAGWVQAVGAVLAILLAIAIPFFQHRRERKTAIKKRAQEEIDFLRRLVPAIRAEVVAAIEAAGLQERAIGPALNALEKAIKAGQTIVDGPPIRAGMTFTDGVIYRAVAAEIGRLPAALVVQVVNFYGRGEQISRLADAARTASESYANILPIIPRFRMSGILLIGILDKLEAANFNPTIDARLNREEIVVAARKVGYPLERIAADYGIEI